MGLQSVRTRFDDCLTHSESLVGPRDPFVSLDPCDLLVVDQVDDLIDPQAFPASVGSLVKVTAFPGEPLEPHGHLSVTRRVEKYISLVIGIRLDCSLHSIPSLGRCRCASQKKQGKAGVASTPPCALPFLPLEDGHGPVLVPRVSSNLIHRHVGAHSLQPIQVVVQVVAHSWVAVHWVVMRKPRHPQDPSCVHRSHCGGPQFPPLKHVGNLEHA